MLEDWRGLAPDPDGAGRCVTAAEALAVLLPKLGLSERLSEEELRAEWKGIVGDFLAGHSEPGSLQRGILTVRVLQPSVRYELERAWKPKVLEKLRARFGTSTIRELRFR
ncbi:MAG: hypothetical protein Fur0032_01270 [Terrimicrobiaceae bacterium]